MVILNFLRNCPTFPQRLHHLTFSPATHKGPNFLTWPSYHSFHCQHSWASGPPTSRPAIFCASWSHRLPNKPKPHPPSHLHPQLPATLTYSRWIQLSTSLLLARPKLPPLLETLDKVRLPVLISSLLWRTGNLNTLSKPLGHSLYSPA